MTPLFRLIDWRLVGAVVLDGLKILVAATIAAAITAHHLLVQFSAAAGRWYVNQMSRPAIAAAPVAPAIHPLAELAADLEQLTATQLRTLLGTNRRCSKGNLVAGALVLV